MKPFYTVSSFRKRWIGAVVLGSLSQKGLFRISSLIIYLLLSPELKGLMSSWSHSPQNLTWCNKNATRFLIFHISLSDWNSSFNDERLFWFWIWRTESEIYNEALLWKQLTAKKGYEIFRKTPSQMLDWVLNTLLYLMYQNAEIILLTENHIMLRVNFE